MKEIINIIEIKCTGTGIGTSCEMIIREEQEEERLYSRYAKVFDDGSRMYTKDFGYNMCFLRHQERYLNDKLKAQGHLFLNEVYEVLGLPRTNIGQLYGWFYDEKNPKYNNHVEFNLYPRIGGDIIVDFNVDGLILHLI